MLQDTSGWNFKAPRIRHSKNFQKEKNEHLLKRMAVRMSSDLSVTILEAIRHSTIPLKFWGQNIFNLKFYTQSDNQVLELLAIQVSKIIRLHISQRPTCAPPIPTLPMVVFIYLLIWSSGQLNEVSLSFLHHLTDGEIEA